MRYFASVSFKRAHSVELAQILRLSSILVASQLSSDVVFDATQVFTFGMLNKLLEQLHMPQ